MASLETPATKDMMATLKQYANYDKPYPKSSHQWGWFTADAAIAGMKKAGANATQEDLISASAAITDWDGGGLTCPVDFSKRKAYITQFTGNCAWIATVKGDGYVSTTDPIRMQIVPGTTNKKVE